MAYGAPAAEADIEPYFTHIRGGRAPSAEALTHLRARYQAIGRSPLIEITRRQAEGLGARLGMPAFVGMKHSAPFLETAAVEARAAGIATLVGLPLAPHYARMSLGAYADRLRGAWGDGPGLVLVEGFHDHPAFVAAVRGLLSAALRDFEADRLFFTAHSLPQRIVDEGDPYRDQLLESCELVAADTRLPPWQLAFQSASATGEPWLGPDLLRAIGESGCRRPLVCPIGFVSDHLEILYDLDVEAQAFAREHDLQLRRTASFNDRPEFLDALAAVVRDRLEG